MSNYTLTSDRLNGHIELQYKEGLLTCILIAVKEPLNERQFNSIVSSVTQKESDIQQLLTLGLNITETLPTNKKIDLFCRLYEFYKKVKYIVHPADTGKIKLIRIDEPMLTAYFTSDNFIFKNKHSISNLVRYYNELRAEIAQGSSSKHPNHWSKTHEVGLDEAGLREYWAHLRGLGLTPVRDRVGNVTDWIPNQTQNN
ncbi:hypothetical protein AB6735_18625 [Mucilaginibacter sp. RCC_168]|uniref:hypothetical protein n=1 Tax=Mucilaginibacter sp. RCC_168 TaxID=3239221 RepID=UPI0035255496